MHVSSPNFLSPQFMDDDGMFDLGDMEEGEEDTTDDGDAQKDEL